MCVLRRLNPSIFLLAGALFLAACDSAEERAEKHYENAIALIEEGDVDRAIVELRNVFQLDGGHVEARRTMADLQIEKGNRRAAYRQYLILAERDPEDVESRIELSEMAFGFQRWDELDRHGDQVETLAPDEPRVKAIALTRAYRTAAANDDAAERRDLGN